MTNDSAPDLPTTQQQLLTAMASVVEMLPPPGTEGANYLAIRIALAGALRELGGLDASDGLFDQVLQEVPDHSGALRGKFWNAMRRGNMSRALAAVDAALDCEPKDPGLLQQKANVLGRLGRHDEAIALLERRREQAPQDAAVQLALARALRLKGEHARADAAFAAILAHAPDNLGALLGRIDSAVSLGDPQLGMGRCDRALEALPGHPQLREKRALLMQQCGRPLEAVRLFRELVDEEPHKPVRKVWLANALRATGDHQAATDTYESVLAEAPDHRGALLGRIDTALAVGDIDTALAHCDDAIARVDDAAIFQRRKATALQRAGRAGEAIGALESLLEGTPDDRPLALELARARLATGDLEGADALFTTVLEAEPNNRGALLGRVDVAERRGDADAAMKLLEASLDLSNRLDGSAAA